MNEFVLVWLLITSGTIVGGVIRWLIIELLECTPIYKKSKARREAASSVNMMKKIMPMMTELMAGIFEEDEL